MFESIENICSTFIIKYRQILVNDCLIFQTTVATANTKTYFTLRSNWLMNGSSETLICWSLAQIILFLLGGIGLSAIGFVKLHCNLNVEKMQRCTHSGRVLTQFALRQESRVLFLQLMCLIFSNNFIYLLFCLFQVEVMCSVSHFGKIQVE